MSEQTNIYIVEDNAQLRHLLRQLIERQPGLVVCGDAATAEAALEQLGSHDVDLVLVDVSLPGMSGIELVGALRERQPAVLCLVLSGHQETRYVQRALAAGARGYLTKDNPRELYLAIEQVLAGHVYLSVALRNPTEPKDGQSVV